MNFWQMIHKIVQRGDYGFNYLVLKSDRLYYDDETGLVMREYNSGTKPKPYCPSREAMQSETWS